MHPWLHGHLRLQVGQGVEMGFVKKELVGDGVLYLQGGRARRLCFFAYFSKTPGYGFQLLVFYTIQIRYYTKYGIMYCSSLVNRGETQKAGEAWNSARQRFFITTGGLHQSSRRETQRSKPACVRARVLVRPRRLVAARRPPPGGPRTLKVLSIGPRRCPP